MPVTSDMPQGLVFWTIYENPSDYPNKYVVRECTVLGGTIVHSPEAKVCDSLDAARQQVPPWLVNIGRQPLDEPQIKEVWV
jgi:hypothetical protein